MKLSQILQLISSVLVLCLFSCKKENDTVSLNPEGGIESSDLTEITKGKDGADALFENLSAGETKVDFVNPIIKDHPNSYLYATAMGCGGVAVGDVNGDGRTDLFLTGGPVPNRLYLQTGDLVFEDATTKSGLDLGNPWSCGASIVDIDNDGDADIYVCNFDSPNFLFINQGDGTFRESARAFGLDFSGAGHTAAFCDFDLDGDLDLYLMTNFFYDPRGKLAEPIVGMFEGKPRVLPEFEKFYQITGVKTGPALGQVNVDHDTVGQLDRFVRNNGDGTFTAQTQQSPMIGKGNAVVWWDPDGDGRPDLYVANDFKDPDRFFKNRPDGTFEDVVIESFPHTTWFSMGADSADLDGDGRPDLMVADMSGTNHFKQKVGMGAMSDSAEFLNTAMPRQYMRNTVYLNTGTDRFREAAKLFGLSNSDWTWTVRLSDFDNDGRVDVFLTNGMAVNLNVADNDAALDALPGETEWAKHMRAGTEPLKDQNLAYRNLGGLAFENVSKSWGLDHVGMSYAATAADLDRDGDLELIVANLDEPVSIYRNNSQTSNRVLVRLRGTMSNKDGLGSTVRVETATGEQVRFLTLNRGYMASGEPIVHFGLGEDTEIKKLSVRWPSGHLQTFENLKSNQLYTITEPGATPKVETQTPVETMFEPMPGALADVRHSEAPFNDFLREPLLPWKLSQFGPGMAWGDIDADGDDDVYLSGAKGSAGQMMRNDSGGKFSPVTDGPWSADAGSEDMGVLFFDADGDDDLDLYVVSGSVECNPGDPELRDRLYLNDGGGNFSKATDDALPAIFESGSAVAASDFDLDGDLDLFVGSRSVPGQYPLAPRSSLLRNEGGKFVDVTEEVAPGLGESGMVTGAVWSDADGDGRFDLMLSCDWAPPRFFQNVDGKLVDRSEAAGFERLWGWWNGIAAGDVDQDGDIDFAVSNFGLNTKYHASFEKPVRLFYGDFDGSGHQHLVEAEYENETLYPVRGRSCSSEAMPFLQQKFGTFREFASASLVDIYTPQKLSSAKQYVATELRSGMLINDGKGVFTFQALPRIAQLAPGFGVDLSDVNGDGNLDLYMVQNFYNPQAETGRMAGGVSQLLLGDGRGGFAPVPPDQSGLVVGEDAKSLTRMDLDGDGWGDFVIGVNDGQVRVFKNRGGDGGRQLSVSLKGKAGNPTGIGAKVELSLADGKRRIGEMTAGGGYLSQNPACVVFGLAAQEKAGGVQVTWPDGEVTKADASGAGSQIEIKHPSRQ